MEDDGRRELRNPGGQRVAGETGANSAPWTRTGRRCWPGRGSLGLPWKAGGLGSSGEQGGRDLRRPRPPVSSPSILGSSPPAVVTSKHPCALPKQRKKSRPSGEMMQGKRRIAELTGQVTRLQAERSLHGENAQLAREAQKLQLPLPAQPHVRVEHVPHLERKRAARARGDAASRGCRGLAVARHVGDRCEKMAEGPRRGLRRSTSSHDQEDLLGRGRAGGPLCGQRERSAS